ncbi:MAG TPA: hypothetical protein VEX38_03130 [Fimbriimonadaceae bacterium]|nr:hypothetical protein [Fimbriimonadaceae bacterium]
MVRSFSSSATNYPVSVEFGATIPKVGAKYPCSLTVALGSGFTSDAYALRYISMYDWKRKKYVAVNQGQLSVGYDNLSLRGPLGQLHRSEDRRNEADRGLVPPDQHRPSQRQLRQLTAQ